LSQNADDAFGRERGIDFNGEGFAYAVVEDVEGSEAFAVVKGVVHEIHGPLEIGNGRGVERHFHTGGKALLGASW
jgi:hypothetical protein